MRLFDSLMVLLIINIFVLLIEVSHSYVNNININKYSISRKQNIVLNDNTISLSNENSVKLALDVLNDIENQQFLQKLILLSSNELKNEIDKANFWFGGTFVIQSCYCNEIITKSNNISNLSNSFLNVNVTCNIKSKLNYKLVSIPLKYPIIDENSLKISLLSLISTSLSESYAPIESISKLSSKIATLPFGDDYNVPSNFRFNDVPHATWVRAYLNDFVKDAVINAIYSPNIPNGQKSRLQIRVNFPEVNIAFDTYRIGTILEMIRHTALCLALNEDKRVKILVQQSLGEGIFTGLPLALASMRIILEKMDWGQVINQQKKSASIKNERQMIGFGALGADQLDDDDDIIIIISPQNVIGASIMDLLEETVNAAKNRPLILFNPSLLDRPSSNNVMQIRGRQERRALSDSFIDICNFRLLYPSSGGYMFPIRGLIVKKNYDSPWVLYDLIDSKKDKIERYEIIAALPPQPTPDTTLISKIFTG